MYEQEIQHKQALVETLRKRLRVLEQQAAQLGLHVPPHIVVEIEDIKGQILTLEAEIDNLRKQAGRRPNPLPPTTGSEGIVLPPAFTTIAVRWTIACVVGFFAEFITSFFLFLLTTTLFWPNIGLAILLSFILSSMVRIYIQYRMTIVEFLSKPTYWLYTNILIAVVIWTALFAQASFNVPGTFHLFFVFLGYSIAAFFVSLWLLERYRKNR